MLVGELARIREIGDDHTVAVLDCLYSKARQGFTINPFPFLVLGSGHARVSLDSGRATDRVSPPKRGFPFPNMLHIQYGVYFRIFV